MRALFLSVFVMFLSACSPFGFNPMGYEVLHEDLDTAWQKVAAMRYIDDNGSSNLKSPKEFFESGGGDCADFASTLMYLLGQDSEYIEIQYLNGDKHALVKYQGEYIDPQIYGFYLSEQSINIIFIFHYQDVMELATNNGKKHIP